MNMKMNGVLECWSVWSVGKKRPICHPLLHHSITPSPHFGPMLIFDGTEKERSAAPAPGGNAWRAAVRFGWPVCGGVQVVSARKMKAIWRPQSYRSVRIPAVRGKILDRKRPGVWLKIVPRYSLSLYLDDLRRQFDAAYGVAIAQARAGQKQRIAAQEKQLGRSLTKAERSNSRSRPIN